MSVLRPIMTNRAAGAVFSTAAVFFPRQYYRCAKKLLLLYQVFRWSIGLSIMEDIKSLKQTSAVRAALQVTVS